MTSIIKVDTIQNSSGTSALSIDSSGRVSRSNIPYFKATASGSINYDNNGDLVIYGNEVVDNASMYNPSTGVVTIPADGLYNLSFDYYGVVATPARCVIHINDVFERYAHRAYSDSTEFGHGSTSAVLSLSAGDEVKLIVETPRVHINAYYNWFTGYLIG